MFAKLKEQLHEYLLVQDAELITCRVYCIFFKLQSESVSPSVMPDTEDASETDLAKHDEDDYVEIKEQ